MNNYLQIKAFRKWNQARYAFKPVFGSNVSKQKTKRAYPQILLQSAHDEDVTYRTKGGKGQAGANKW